MKKDMEKIIAHVLIKEIKLFFEIIYLKKSFL
jgi:hypothetical protein